MLTDSEINAQFVYEERCKAVTIPSNEEILKWSKIIVTLNGNVVARAGAGAEMGRGRGGGRQAERGRGWEGEGWYSSISYRRGCATKAP